MPPSPSGASTTSSAAASGPSSTPHDNDSRVLVLGVVLAIVGALLVAGIVYMTIRFRRRAQTAANDTSPKVDNRSYPSHGTSLSRDHVAARITPFGSVGAEAPRFAHRPGENMRIATRRSDGAWTFFDPRASVSPLSPYTPSTDGHDSALPSPAPSALTFTTYSSGHPLLRSDHGHSPLARTAKEREVQMYSERARTQSRHLDVHDSEYPLEEAPPAYVHESRESTRGRARRGSLPPTPH